MRSPDDVLQELERDRLQRESEIRLIENLVIRLTSCDEQSMLRRSLVLLTYAHLEGFCKFALLAYASVVNAAEISCREAAAPLVAATLTSVFAALRDVNSKHPAFARCLPDDSSLHMTWREQRFVEDFDKVCEARVDIPDRIVDGSSNMKAVVLKRNMFRLGLNYTSVEHHTSALNRLLGVRNAIAHGDALKVPKENDVKEYVAAAFSIMGVVQNEIYDALRVQ